MLAAAAAEAPTDGAVPYTAVVSRPKTAGGKAAALVRVTRTFDFKDLTPFQACAILVDKPEGWTSFDVVNKVRGALDFLKVVKVGHAGTLDPAATGLLVLCTGKATRLVDEFQAQEKVYTGTLRLGEGTESYDAETPVTTSLPWEHVTDDALQAAVASLTGVIEQTPPVYSAVRVGNKRMYELARAGTADDLDRTQHARSITIREFTAWRDAPGSQDVNFRVACSKGTYVRTLAHDLGTLLGTAAHLKALRRESIGDLLVADAWHPKDLAQELYNEGKKFRDKRRAQRAAAAAAEEEARLAAAAQAAAVADLSGAGREPQEA